MKEFPIVRGILHFRRILEKNKLPEKIFCKVNEIMERLGKMLRGGTAVDEAIIQDASSTKNKEGKTDEDIHSSKKSGQYYFGMKEHIGIDVQSGMVHSITATVSKEK